MKRTSLQKGTKNTTQRLEGRKLHTQPKEKLKTIPVLVLKIRSGLDPVLTYQDLT